MSDEQLFPPGSAAYYRRRFESSVLGNHMMMPPMPVANCMVHPEAPPTHPTGPNTNFQYPTPMPYRYSEDSISAHNSVRDNKKVEHPIYSKSSDVIGKLNMQATDLPMRWYGLEGTFTSQWNSALPKTRVATGLNSAMDRSKFHHEFDQGWKGNLGLTDCARRRIDTRRTNARPSRLFVRASHVCRCPSLRSQHCQPRVQHARGARDAQAARGLKRAARDVGR